MSASDKQILSKINNPEDLKQLAFADLPKLAEEIRSLIIKTVSANGGHLASNLGPVELTIALLRTFSPPHDKIIWDVSHQAYTYKILTGRRDRFHTLRQTDGLSGFLSRAESPYDAFGAGHAGTALSAALGMAAARDRKKSNEHVVAVVGDGALGCGSSFEALNNLAFTTKRLIVIVNDNEMSISANVGTIARYLGSLLVNPRYNRWKSSVENVARNLIGFAWLRKIYTSTQESVKSFFLGSILFEEFGLRYIGPIDGHDYRNLLDAMEIARNSQEPILLHVATQKGRGYALAEQDPDIWHGTGAFECATGEPLTPHTRLRYSEVFGKTVKDLAEKDDRLIAITAAMAVGTGLTGFAKSYPDRFFDVGISEEHAVIFAAGLAAAGFRPYLVLYSTFTQRVVDYIIHDVCLQKLPVVFCLDRAGIIGDDGPTHHGIFDIPLLRSIPGLIIAQPCDEAELEALLHSALEWGQPAVIRYPRGCGPGSELSVKPELVSPGQARMVAEGDTVQIWALGDMVPFALEVADILKGAGVATGVVNARFIKPLDLNLLQASSSAKVIVTLENSAVTGGFGTALGESLADCGFAGRLLKFGWPDRFLPHGALEDLYKRYGFTVSAVVDAVKQALSSV